LADDKRRRIWRGVLCDVKKVSRNQGANVAEINASWENLVSKLRSMAQGNRGTNSVGVKSSESVVDGD
jgi:hypothetical protein